MNYMTLFFKDKKITSHQRKVEKKSVFEIILLLQFSLLISTRILNYCLEFEIKKTHTMYKSFVSNHKCS